MGFGDCEGGVLKAQDTAVELYKLAALMLGDEGEALELVESTVADVEVDPCAEEDGAVDTARHHLIETAIARMNQVDPRAFAVPAPTGGPASCIEDDDLAAAGISAAQIAELINGAANVAGSGDRLRTWLNELPRAQRAIFVQRAVLGWDNGVTAAALAKGVGTQPGWSAAQVGESFRQALCSLANALVHSEAERVTA
jgi:hypothetical protein